MAAFVAGLAVEARWGWQGVAPSLLTNIAAGLGFVGVVVALERRIVREVARARIAYCTLEEPPALIKQSATHEGELVFVCTQSPNHIWDYQTGGRRVDLERMTAQ